MKKLILTVTASLACVAAFAQGKVQFANDSAHLYYYTTATSGLRAADQGLAGNGVSITAMPVGVTLVADLYGGTSSSALTLLTSTSFGATVGRQAAANITTTFGGGVPAFFQVQVRDSAYTNADAAFVAGSYSGKGIIFQSNPSTSAYNSIINPNSLSFSTWTAGTFDMSTQSGLAGARGAIVIAAAVPEPASFALAGLGIAALAILRRRK